MAPVITDSLRKKASQLSADLIQKHLSLRRFTLSDVDAYMNWATDEKVHQFFQNSPLSTKQEALQELESHVIPHPWYRAICLCDRPIGYVHLERGEGDYLCVGDITYCLAAKYWGLGITTAAIKLAVSAIFREVKDLQRIRAFIVKENVSSRKVVQKVGFKEECFLEKIWDIKEKKRDVVMYELSRRDYYVQKYGKRVYYQHKYGKDIDMDTAMALEMWQM